MKILGFDPTKRVRAAEAEIATLPLDACPDEFAGAVNRAVAILRGEARRPCWRNHDDLHAIVRDYRDRRDDLEAFATVGDDASCSRIEVHGYGFPNGETVAIDTRISQYDAVISIRARVLS